ncbi:MAG TPA: hypothetical protein VHT91_43365 [Kofleriaceae bacterium]|jgi:hypothetical protein|nr:hypothetical protein [Kofleriaceae bacterium]
MLLRSLASTAVIAALAAPAHAQSAAQAEVMFRNAKRLLGQGKTAEACAAFDAAQKLEPTVNTLLNQANCREKNGQFATAWGLFLDAERDTRASADEDGKQLHKIAVDHAAKLESRLSTLRIVVAADRRPTGLEIRRGNELIDPVMWNQALPIDGGTYKIVARVPGAPEWSSSVVVAAENDARSVEIPRLGAQPAATRSAEPGKPRPADPRPAAPQQTRAPASAPAEPGKPRPADPRLTRPPAPAPAPAPAAPPDVPLPGDGKTPWYCTESHRVSVGTCRPEQERCEEFRATMAAQIRDLVPCRAAYSVVCFGLAGAPHCAPSTEICETLRGSVQDRATACQTRRVAPEPPPPPAAPRPPMWWCTDSRSADIGICKPTRGDCEAFRSSLLGGRHDLSECHELARAMCFEAGSLHCAPSREVCDALREASHQTAPCAARALPAPPARK